MADYQVCTQLERRKNIYGGYDCDNWEVVTISDTQTVDFFPQLTIQQANEISIQCCLLLALAYGFRVVAKLI